MMFHGGGELRTENQEPRTENRELRTWIFAGTTTGAIRFQALYHTRRSFYDAVTSYPAARHRSDWNMLAGSDLTSQLRNRHKAG